MRVSTSESDRTAAMVCEVGYTTPGCFWSCVFRSRVFEKSTRAMVGYFVDFSEEQFQFGAKCSEEGEFTNPLECLPVDCRAAPEPRHTRN